MPGPIPSLRGLLSRVKRKRAGAAPTQFRNHLTVGIDAGVAQVSGSLAPGYVVDGLILRLAGDLGRLSHVIEQAPTPAFDFAVDLGELRRLMSGDAGQYDLFLRGRHNDAPAEWRLGNFGHTDRESAIDPVQIGDTKAWWHVTGKGNMSLHFGHEMPLRLKSTSQRLVTKNDNIHFDILLESYSRPVEKVVGTWVGRQSQQRIEFDIELTERPEARLAGFGLFSYDVSGVWGFGAGSPEYAPEDVNFDLHIEVTLRGDDEAHRRGIKASESRWQPVVREAVAHHGANSHVFIPYFTFRGQRLAFWAETFTDDNYRLIRRLRFVSWTFFVVRPFLRIWLIGETPYKAQDNGFHFFRWMRANHPKRRAFYVIESDSPDLARVTPYGNVIERFSRRHILYTLLASRFVGSHHAEYLFASRIPSMIKRSRGVRIFLQHGVTAAKNVILNYGRRMVFEMPADVFIVNSELERAIVVQDLQFLPSQVKITGFARFDELFADDVEVERSILIMPTWRDWLMLHETFLESEYLERWRNLLQHRGLHDLAQEFGMRIEFILHPNMRRYARDFEVEGVDLKLSGDEDLQNLIKRSAVMVTDYSSVAWDFSFLGKPVHYFQFDQSRFIGNRAPHIDYATQLPGKIARHESLLVDDLRATLQSGLQVLPEYERRSRAFLTHRDQQNCARTYDVVTHAAGPGAFLTRLRNARNVRDAYDRIRVSRFYHPAMTWAFRLAKLLPKRNLIVFESDRGLSYGDSPRALFECLQGRDHDFDLVYVSNTTTRLPGGDADKIRRLGPKYYWLMGRAKFWINNQNVPVQFKPSRGNRLIQTWHGTPLKKMQHDVKQMHGRRDNYEDEARRLVSYWDTLISPSPYATRAFRSAFQYNGPVVERGYPRNDVFFAPDRAGRVDAIRQRLGLADGRKVVLYAPTFRDDMRRGVNWTADLALDLMRMKEEIGEDFVVLLRFHKLVRRNLDNADELADFVIDVSHYADVQELLLVSDVLITDYSSLMFDYACLDRPMLFFTYDLDHYRENLRGFYFDFEAQAPGPLLFTSDEVTGSLKDLDRIAVDYATRLTEFRHKFCPLEDGKASDRVLDAILGGRSQS